MSVRTTRGDKCRGSESGEQRPPLRALNPHSDAEDKDERVDGQQIAGEQSSAEDGEGDPVGGDEEKDGAQNAWRKAGRRVALRQEQACESEDDG